ncbi:hypothetical protein niasHT_006471 [Heterodera trifolii]|uniref:Heat shock protein 70 n=1 Tax=Heterodera trifolii TaxID=157864 RepID=A0ABD2LSE3_9BILA
MSSSSNRSLMLPQPRNRKSLWTGWTGGEVTTGVYEGENRLTRHNNLLGIVLLDIQPAPRGVPMIEMTFDMDENGTLNVMAQEKSAGGQKPKMNIYKWNG